MSSSFSCRQCGGPLALADLACGACAAPVPAEDRRESLLSRAQGQFDAGQFAEAARSLEILLQGPVPPEEARLLWRKRGAWLQRAQRPELLDAAEAALAESLRLDDADDLSHQLWIDLLTKRGTVEKARQWYAQRLQLRPEDAMAARQLLVIKLSADFKAAPPPKLDLPPEAAGGSLYRLLKPSPSKTAAAGLGLLVNGALAVRAAFSAPAVVGDPSDGLAQVGSFMQLLNDPWLPGLQALACAAYLFWAWKAPRG